MPKLTHINRRRCLPQWDHLSATRKVIHRPRHDTVPPPRVQPMGNHATQPTLVSTAIGTKLKISQPGDRYEKEANRVAKSVVRMPEPNVREQPALSKRLPRVDSQPECGDCYDRLHKNFLEREVGQELWPSKGALRGIPQGTPDLAARTSTLGLRGDGQPLPQSVRSFFEPRFGCDLSRVRIHTDTAASITASNMQARAYTFGRHMAFGNRQYAPSSVEGRHLLAHELAHVIQQGGGSDESLNSISSSETYIQRTSYTDNCNHAQLPSLHAAVFKSRTDMREVRDRLMERPLSQVVRDALWLAFRNASEDTAKRAHHILDVIYRRLPSATIDCEQETDSFYRSGCGDEEEGYTWHSPLIGAYGDIHVCMGIWPRLNEVRRSHIITHEGAHLFVGASDDGGYFEMHGCAETSSTASSPSETRLNNADSFACLVHYLTRTPPGVLSQWAADLSGSTQLQIAQDPQGVIDLDSNVTDSPRFEVNRASTGEPFFNPVISYRWIIADNADERYLMRNIFGALAYAYGEHEVTIIPARTRALLRSRAIRSARVLCRVRTPRVETRLLSIPVRFTSALWGRSI
jgi:hypothetical protein